MQKDKSLKNYNSSGEQLSLFLNLDGFEGPIDLLLHLSREQKVDLASISIAELANQYIEFIEKVKILNIEIAADYLVMAAWLAYLKSKILLPDLEKEEEAENIELISSELRSRLPNSIGDDIVTVLSNSKQALLDFANIRDQRDVEEFNQRYNLNLTIPQEG